MSNNETITQLAAESASYRDACAAAVAPGERNLLGIAIGHGTYLMCSQIAEKCGALRTLAVLPSQSVQTALTQLERWDGKTVEVPRKRGSMADICRQAASFQPSRPVVYLATTQQAADAGRWCDAWQEKKPFDLLILFDADQFTSLKSERAKGLDSLARRAGTSVFIYNKDDVVQNRIRMVQEAWGTLGSVEPEIGGGHGDEA